MATESYYQSKIIKEIEKQGGRAINGTFTKKGEADLQCGYLFRNRLYDLAIEVKTEKDYFRVMSCLKIVNNRYVIENSKKLKPQETLQISKLNNVRDLGGLALLAWNYNQVEAYCITELNKDNR